MLYNILSIFFGLSALGLPALVLLRRTCPGAWGALASGACCAAALLCQLLEQARRVRLGDLAAVADTAQAVCAAAGALAVLTLVLNALALYRRR